MGGIYIGIDFFGFFWLMLLFELVEFDENFSVDLIIMDWLCVFVFGFDY